MKEEHEVRIGANEAVFREVNEGIDRGVWPGEEEDRRRFRCECARLSCNEYVELAVRIYERVREHPRWFLVVSGHELPEAEIVVERHPEYVVVEKYDEAGAIAEETDPRA